MIEVERWPGLRDPAMVIALGGWVDAGFAGVGAAATLAQQLEAGRRFGVLDLADLLDLRQTRPTVELAEGVTRALVWPALELVAGRAGRDVVLVTGPEPSIRWRAVCDELVGVAKRLKVSTALTMGGMPMGVSHHRPVSVLATATSHSLAQESGALRVDYSGPTGMQTVLQVALGQAGIPALGLWAQVPHYLAATPSPPAIRAMLARAAELGRFDVDLSPLDAQCDTYLQQVEAGLADRADVAELVRRLDDEGEELPSADELASEIERFLRDQR